MKLVREAFRSSEALRLIAPSIGIVRCDEAGLTLDELIRRADVAMYTAKRGKLGLLRLRTGSGKAFGRSSPERRAGR